MKTTSRKRRCRPNRFVTRRLGIDEGIQGKSKDGGPVPSLFWGCSLELKLIRAEAEALLKEDPKKMTGCRSQSSDDLTIILPRSDFGALGSGSNRLKSWSRGSGPRSESLAWDRGVQLEKSQCSASKRHWPRWQVVGTMALFGLVLATTLTAATWKSRRPMPPGEQKIAAVVVGQPDLREVLLSTPAVQYPIAPSCSTRTTEGTAVNFVATPAEAAREARKTNKLTFLLHISGNFEDADFT